ncbi:hypothetical protein NDK47_10375 [Brevibacillus ruminantium]|uniref:Uncharacterized protein n=1 Tax=Brevibacillus ruminantium TaxID=2950604 RepID=A0ABY4WKJ8_9BACL|nr:hypothetical protein [Brevibacillus ruminantium]USG67647.1 hypothetical protein NDK47_10375 [Brevibacillus ruminantium]
MNVIGIIQTDLNEFSVLFEPDQSGQQGNQQQGNNNQQGGNSSSSQDGQGQNDNDSMFLSFLEDQSFGDQTQRNTGGYGSNPNQQQNAPQELTVRIKGIPEGQKANFLQMYQILHDAKDTQTLQHSLTIVQNSDQQNQGAGNNNNQGSGGGNNFSSNSGNAQIQ